mmetsp:Transcript_125832/g.361854  ORF Transcript_125832/g.361854 Transcript_125832/m.361854 type:complete len:207 (-) Transcript_125832:294-914(-)
MLRTWRSFMKQRRLLPLSRRLSSDLGRVVQRCHLRSCHRRGRPRPPRIARRRGAAASPAAFAARCAGVGTIDWLPAGRPLGTFGLTPPRSFACCGGCGAAIATTKCGGSPPRYGRSSPQQERLSPRLGRRGCVLWLRSRRRPRRRSDRRDISRPCRQHRTAQLSVRTSERPGPAALRRHWIPPRSASRRRLPPCPAQRPQRGNRAR